MKRKAKKVEEKFVLLVLRDHSDSNIYQEFVIKTNLDEKIMTDKITETVKKWVAENEDHSWTYDEIVKTLEKEGLIKIIPFEKYEVFI